MKRPQTHLRRRFRCATPLALTALALLAPARNTEAETKATPAASVDTATLDALAQGVRVEGVVVMNHTTNGRTRYLERIVRLKLSNESGIPLHFGDDLLVMETDKGSTTIGGSLVLFNRRGEDHDSWWSFASYRSYGVPDFQSYLVGSLIKGRVGGSFSASTHFSAYGHEPQVFARSLGEGDHGWILLTIDQGEWVADSERTSVFLTLPEVRTGAADSPERFRAVLDLKASGEGAMRWEVGDVRWIPIEPAGLAELALSPRETVFVRIMAANWLSEAFPVEAIPLIRDAAPGLPEGPLAGCYLALAARLKIEGLIPLAVRVRGDAKAPDVARRAAVDYLAVYCDSAGVAALEDAVSANGDAFLIQLEAVKALVQPGNAEAASALMRILHDGEDNYVRGKCAGALARTGDVKGRTFLMEAAERGEEWAMAGLAEAADPDLFDFFTSRAADAEANDERIPDNVLRGLRQSGGGKSLPILLEFVGRHKEAEKREAGSLAAAAAAELGELDGPQVVAALAALARAGNHSAVTGLAKCREPSARAVLEEIVRRGPGAMRTAALSGLEVHWSAESADLLLEILKSDDKDAREMALRGLAREGDERAVKPLLELCRSGEDDGRLLSQFPLRDHLSEVFEVFLEKETPYLAGALIQHGFHDATSLAKLRGHVMAKVKEEASAKLYHSLFLLRTLSGSTMGPESYMDYITKEEKWNKEWATWCEKQL